MHDDKTSRVAKGAKRGKYVVRACLQCQRRKIKCEGGTPCTPCISHGRDCVSRGYTLTPFQRGRALGPGESLASVLGGDTTNQVSGKALLDRLAHMEELLASFVRRERQDGLEFRDDGDTSRLDVPDLTRASPELIRASNSVSDCGSPLRMAEIYTGLVMEDFATSCSDTESIPSQRDIEDVYRTLRPFSSTIVSVEQCSKGWLKALVLSYHIIPNEALGSQLIKAYFDEIHVLYPYLHAPCVRRTFDWIWKRDLIVSTEDLASANESKSSLALMFFCIANVFRMTPAATTDAQARHSMGGNLYNLGTHLIRDLLDPLHSVQKPGLIQVQATLQMVIYHYALSEIQTAESILAMVITQSYALGIHRQQTIESLPMFEAEISRRTWWTLFILDRQIALESGHPSLIDQTKVDTQVPLVLSDDFLELYKNDRRTSFELQNRIGPEIETNAPTPIHYLLTVLAYSKIAEDVWKILFTHNQDVECNVNTLENRLEALVEEVRVRRSSYLIHQPCIPFREQYCNLEWSQIKQSLDLYFRYLLLKVPIHSQIGSNPPSKDRVRTRNLESNARSGQLASAIIMTLGETPNKYPKYSFPFTKHILVATTVLINLAGRSPLLTGEYFPAIARAMEELDGFSQNLSLGGKTLRMIAHLRENARRLYPNLGMSLLTNSFYPEPWDRASISDSRQDEGGHDSSNLWSTAQCGSHNNLRIMQGQRLEGVGLTNYVQSEESARGQQVTGDVRPSQNSLPHQSSSESATNVNVHRRGATTAQQFGAQCSVPRGTETLDATSQQASSFEIPDSSMLGNQFSDCSNWGRSYLDSWTGNIIPLKESHFGTLESSNGRLFGQ